MKRKIIDCLFFAAVLITYAPRSDAQKAPAWIDRLGVWICHHLGYACPPRSIFTNREPEERPIGRSLVMVETIVHARTAAHSSASRILWEECQCWSPVPLGGGRIAVLTEAGVWVFAVSDPQKRRLVFPGKRVRELIGVMPGTVPSALLLLQSSEIAGCTYRLQQMNLSDFSVGPTNAPEAIACGTDFDFRDLIKPAQISSAGALITWVQLDKYQIAVVVAGNILPLILQATNKDMDVFDAVWLKDNMIVFLAGLK